MTHDELLADIDERASYLGNVDSVYIALRTVVELLKETKNDTNVIANEEFNQGIKAMGWVIFQLIEKELG